MVPHGSQVWNRWVDYTRVWWCASRWFIFIGQYWSNRADNVCSKSIPSLIRVDIRIVVSLHTEKKIIYWQKSLQNTGLGQFHMHFPPDSSFNLNVSANKATPHCTMSWLTPPPQNVHLKKKKKRKTVLLKLTALTHNWSSFLAWPVCSPQPSDQGTNTMPHCPLSMHLVWPIGCGG